MIHADANLADLIVDGEVDALAGPEAEAMQIAVGNVHQWNAELAVVMDLSCNGMQRGSWATRSAR